ncbi:MAG: agmatinase [Phycisphaerales bacterium]|nr:MAG: agmatinase [Phycisphaerales bacterium]
MMIAYFTPRAYPAQPMTDYNDTVQGYDPEGDGDAGGIFGLPPNPDHAEAVIIPVPFDATTSYHAGTADAPRRVRDASVQVDMHDHRFGRADQRGLHLEDEPEGVRELSEATRKDVERLTGDDANTMSEAERGEAYARVNAASERMLEIVRTRVRAILDAGKLPVILGGDHSTPLGAIRACAERFGPLGVLQIDAHMDFREAYQGFTHSHASIMYNALHLPDALSHVVQVGIRDYSSTERAIGEQDTRVRTFFDDDLADRLAAGELWRDLCREMIQYLPENVYVTFDIDGLDPALCPTTGTPVPGGLSFQQVSILLQTLAESGKRVVGCDLVEVGPGRGEGDEFDANVGARILYRLLACALATR